MGVVWYDGNMWKAWKYLYDVAVCGRCGMICIVWLVLAGVGKGGKGGKNRVSGKVWLGWLGLREIYIYLLHARTRIAGKNSHIQNFAYLYGDFVVTEIVTIGVFCK